MCPDKEDRPALAGPLVDSTTILIAEDEVLIRLNIAEVLRERGYVVLEAANAEEARAIFESDADVCFLFSDIHMPRRGDGIALAQWVEEQFSETYVVLTSAIQSSLDEARQRCSNVSAYILKPYHHDLVLAEVQRMIAKRHAE